MNNLDYNSLNDRLDSLFHSTDRFVSRTSIADLSVTKTTTVSPEGNQTFQISLGGGQISAEELKDARHCFTDMISRISNLKDHIKRNLKSSGLDPEKAEDEINSSSDLRLIIDLNNQEKHGYPLTRSRRSKLDPLIKNIRKESSIPLTSGRFTNFVTESVVTYEADVCMKNGELICDFRMMIEGAIRSWENFLIANMPARCNALISRRALENAKCKWQEYMEIKRNKVIALENNVSGWEEISGDSICDGMYIKAKGFLHNSVEHRGFPVQKNVDFEGKESIPIFEVIFGMTMDLSKSKNKWWVLSCESESDLELISNYYWELYNPPAFKSE